MFRVVTQGAEEHLPRLNIEHEQPKRKLQPEPPSDSFKFDRAPIVENR